MESAQALKIVETQIIERKQGLDDWLRIECGMPADLLQPMKGDASTRLYYRLTYQGQSFVVVDAPPPQDTYAFSMIAKALRELGIAVPDILQANLTQGFLLITDFGELTFLKGLNENNADQLYHSALETLITIQSCTCVPGMTIPPFTADFMFKEWAWHKEWFLEKLLGLPLKTIDSEIEACYAYLVKSAVSQPQVFMHRDFHSANLMVIPQKRVGVLDFQDAFFGPLTYDLASLLSDCYIQWPKERVLDWALFYFQKIKTLKNFSHITEDEFLCWLDLMGMQRHLKALMTFARKYVRDGQTHYLQYIPPTLNYICDVAKRYQPLQPLYHYFNNDVVNAYKQVKI